MQNKWQTVFMIAKSVAPSGIFRWYRKIRLDRKLQVGETEFTQRKTLVTSAHQTSKISQRFAMNQLKKLQGIWYRNMQNKNQGEKSERFQMKFLFLFCLKKKETNMQGTNAVTQKRTQENFIQNWAVTQSPMLEYIDLGVK